MERFAGAQAHSQALVGLLARLSGRDAPSVPSPASRLAGWIDWPQAVAVSAALEPRAASVAPPVAASDEPHEEARVRAAVVGAIEGDRAFAIAATDPLARDPAFFRQRYVSLQQVMEGEVGLSRKRLRERIAREAPRLGRLVALDAVMERALGSRERALLGSIPDLLATHFRRVVGEIDAAGTASTAVVDGLPQFRRDMKRLLLAELDVRLQPTRGLHAALRTTLPDRHE